MKIHPIVAAALAMTAASQAFALNEVVSYGIANFGSSGAAYCGGATLGSHAVHTATADAFRAPFSALKLASMWDDVDSLTNASVTSAQVSGSTKIASGADQADHKGSDDADVFYIHTHGTHTSSGASQFSGLVMGSSASGVCTAKTSDHMLFGKNGNDNDMAVVKACQSADYDVFVNGGYFAMNENSSQQRLWNGFHGDSSCGAHVTAYVSAYSWLSFAEGAGENWLDLAYDDNAAIDSDDCPASIAFGDSQAKREALYEHGGFLDRKDTGNKTAATYWYFRGCDPSSGRVLP